MGTQLLNKNEIAKLLKTIIMANPGIELLVSIDLKTESPIRGKITKVCCPNYSLPWVKLTNCTKLEMALTSFIIDNIRLVHNGKEYPIFHSYPSGSNIEKYMTFLTTIGISGYHRKFSSLITEPQDVIMGQLVFSRKTSSYIGVVSSVAKNDVSDIPQEPKFDYHIEWVEGNEENTLHSEVIHIHSAQDRLDYINRDIIFPYLMGINLEGTNL